MENVNLAIIYYSATGTNYKLAQTAAEAAKEKAGVKTKTLKIKETAPKEAIASNPQWQEHVNVSEDVPEISLDDLEWADAIIFSIPTRYGNLPSQVQQFFDTTGGLWAEGKLANKVVSGMTSAQNLHGGQETTLISLYKTMIHWGAVIAAPGFTDKVLFAAGGNPYGISVSAGTENITAEVKTAIAHQVERTLTVAKWVKKGKSEQ
ncbi:MAG TPA: NAD(P)H-dependent oxidoreductase [Salinimicrobium sp.]|nr:NAD(P)H-dependent oxidoreductase [Salinimicrobium sp.]